MGTVRCVLAVAVVGAVTALFAVLMVKVPYFRVANWPNMGIGLFLMGLALSAAPAASWLLNAAGVARAVGALLGVVIAMTAFAGLVAFWWVPPRWRHRLGGWDAIASNPWTSNTQRERRDNDH